MSCVKTVPIHQADPMPFECESGRTGPDLDQDVADQPDEDDSDTPEEAGYGYGV